MQSKITLATDVIVLTTEDKPTNNKRLVPEKGFQILLIKRNWHPHEGMWSLPGGFVDEAIGLLNSVKLKLHDKTGLDNIYIEQLYTYGDDVCRDSRGRVVTVGYIALAPKEQIVLHKEKASREADWFWIEPSDDGYKFIRVSNGETVHTLAFDHNILVKDTLTRLKNKVMYTDVAFHLVNQKFTLKALQTAYELILGEQIQAFRRVIDPKVVELDEWTDGKAHRPARLYRKKRDGEEE